MALQNHPFCQFDNSARERKAAEEFEKLWARVDSIEQPRQITQEFIESLNQTDRWVELVPLPWNNLFAIFEPVYTELVLEFFSTYQFKFPYSDVSKKNKGVTFRLGGAWNEMSIGRFGRTLGLYTREEVSSSAFKSALQVLIDSVNRETFWVGISKDTHFDPRRTKATQMLDPLHRLLTRVIQQNVGGRAEKSLGTVSTRDIFHIYCITQKKDCNVAASIAEALTRAARKGSGSRIVMGHIITHLARELGVFNNAAAGNMTLHYQCLAIDPPMLQSMKLISVGGNRLVDHRGRIWDPYPPESEYEEEAGSESDDEGEDVRMDSPPQAGVQQEDPHMGHTTDQIWQRLDALHLGQQQLIQGHQRMEREQARQGHLASYTTDYTRDSFQWLFDYQTRPDPSIPYQPPPQWSYTPPTSDYYGSTFFSEGGDPGAGGSAFDMDRDGAS